MNDDPLVSSIIIFFNSVPYLEEAIDSVLAQTYRHWELLLCDDGSTDGSTEIAQRYAEHFPDQVRYFEHTGHVNRGMSTTRNLGLQHAKGEYIAWLDADDVWLPQKLERQVQLMHEHPEAAMIYGPLQVWFSWTGRAEDFRSDFVQDIGVPHDTLLPPPQLLIAFLQNDMYIPSGVLVRRAVLKEVGGFEPAFRDEFSDVVVHAKVCLKWPTFAAGESWYKYRQHAGSYCAQTRRGERSRRLRYLDSVAERLSDEGYDKGEVWQVVQEQIRLHRSTLRNAWMEWTEQGAAWVQRGYWQLLRCARKVAERILPPAVRSWVGLQVCGRTAAPPSGWVHFGNLRRVTPISKVGGRDRGVPIDHYYIEQFLAVYASDIRGRVLEVGQQDYTCRFGGNRVTQADVLHTGFSNFTSVLVGDLCTGEGIPTDAFDCILLMQVVTFLQDCQVAIANAYRALKPGGVLLVSVPDTVKGNRNDIGNCFTACTVRRLFAAYFDPEHLEIEVYGNVLTAVALLHGMAAHELSSRELDYRDPDYAVIITVRAVKAEASA